MFKCWCQIFKKCPSPTFFLFCFKSARLLPSLSVKMGKQESEICQLFNKMLVRKKKNASTRKLAFGEVVAEQGEVCTCCQQATRSHRLGCSCIGVLPHQGLEHTPVLSRFHSYRDFIPTVDFIPTEMECARPASLGPGIRYLSNIKVSQGYPVKEE